MPINMSYCIFENNLASMNEAREHLESNGVAARSARELRSLKELVRECSKFIELYQEYEGEIE